MDLGAITFGVSIIKRDGRLKGGNDNSVKTVKCVVVGLRPKYHSWDVRCTFNVCIFPFILMNGANNSAPIRLSLIRTLLRGTARRLAAFY